MRLHPPEHFYRAKESTHRVRTQSPEWENVFGHHTNHTQIREKQRKYVEAKQPIIRKQTSSLKVDQGPEQTILRRRDTHTQESLVSPILWFIPFSVPPTEFYPSVYL